MKTLIIVCVAIFTFNSLYAQPGWFPVYSDSSQGLESSFFPDVNTGYIVAQKVIDGIPYCRIFKTTNAGSGWFEQTTPQRDSANFWFRCVFFTDVNTGFVAVSQTIGTIGGRILKTTNGGNNWYITPIPVKNIINNVYFVNPSTGYASGYQTILKTTDAGITWNLQNPNFGSSLFGIHFTDPDIGYVVGNLGGIIKTTNGGANWNPLNSTTNISLWGIDFTDANTGVAVGGPHSNIRNIILRTTDAGESWTQISYTYSTCLLWSVAFVSSTIGWISGSCNQILKTTDGGLNWYNQSSPSTNNYTTCSFTSDLTGYVVGEPTSLASTEPGYVLKTTDGGGAFVGIGNANIEFPVQFHLNQNYPNPFNPSTKIKFDLPISSSASGANGRDVRLVVYDVFGREVKVLLNDRLESGKHEIEWDATDYPSGVYFYKLSIDNFSEAKTMILLK